MKTERIASRWAMRAAGTLALVCVPTVTLAAGWTPWCSEETAPVTCPDGEGVIGVECSGDYCDNLRLNCAPPAGNIVFRDHWWTTFFSEENGTKTCIGPLGLGVVTGIQCRGDYCDDISFRCSRVTTGIVGVHVKWANPVWSPYISEETGPFVSWTNFISGADCNGDYCDDMAFAMSTW